MKKFTEVIPQSHGQRVGSLEVSLSPKLVCFLCSAEVSPRFDLNEETHTSRQQQFAGAIASQAVMKL